MKKDSFIRGAAIATLCIVISKILGIVYVIPFHAIIDENGRVLYGYAYNFYQLFLTISTIGLPIAISKVVSEYNTLGFHDLKKRSYSLAFKLMVIMSVIVTVVILFIAPMIADTIIGNLVGGNTKEDIVFVIRISTLAITFVTILSSMRGYLQGHKYISPSSISEVLEQFARVVVIILGSYITVSLFGMTIAVGIAVFGATIGAVVGCIYLFPKMKLLKKDNNHVLLEKEKNVSNWFLIKKILSYAIPFIVVGMASSLFNTIDMLTVIPLYIEHGGLSTIDAETILSIITTWGAKLNVIVTSLAAGLVVSVLPNITSDFVAKRMVSLKSKVNVILQIIFYIVLPMIVGMSLLATPIWTVFYDTNPLGAEVFSLSVMTALFYSLFLNINAVMQAVGKIKISNIAIISGVLLKLILNGPLIALCGMLGLPIYLGSILATIIGYGSFIVVCLLYLKKHIEIKYSDTIKTLFISLLGVLVMALVILGLNYLLPIKEYDVMMAIIKIIIYAIVGIFTYFFVTSRFKLFEKIFEMSLRELIFSKILRRKKRS